MSLPELAPKRMDVQAKRARLAELVEDKMDQLGLKNYQEFADHFGLGRSTVYELLRGRSRTRGAFVSPKGDTMVLIARALELPLHEIVYYLLPDAPGADEFFEGSYRTSIRFQVQKEVDVDVLQLPVREVPVRRAGWAGAGPDQSEEIFDEFVYVEEEFAQGKDLIAFRIRGDSMEAGKHPIFDGDTVFVNRFDKGAGNTAVVARLTEDGYVCKMLKDDKYGRFLQSANVGHTNGTPSVIQMYNVSEIVGRVVRVVHDTVSDA